MRKYLVVREKMLIKEIVERLREIITETTGTTETIETTGTTETAVVFLNVRAAEIINGNVKGIVLKTLEDDL